MKASLLFDFTVDKANNTVNVRRAFTAPLREVWASWTDSQLLDQWWAPRPWRTETKVFQFEEGGLWLYAMVGPEGERHWCRSDYRGIEPQKSFSAYDAFCDEGGTVNPDSPRALWTVHFLPEGEHTVVTIRIEYKTSAELEQIIGMGFEEGFTMSLGNLDALVTGTSHSVNHPGT